MSSSPWRRQWGQLIGSALDGVGIGRGRILVSIVKQLDHADAGGAGHSAQADGNGSLCRCLSGLGGVGFSYDSLRGGCGLREKRQRRPSGK